MGRRIEIYRRSLVYAVARALVAIVLTAGTASFATEDVISARGFAADRVLVFVEEPE